MERPHKRGIQYFAIVLYVFAALMFCGAAIGVFTGAVRFASGAAIFGGILLICGMLAWFAGRAGRLVEERADNTPMTRQRGAATAVTVLVFGITGAIRSIDEGWWSAAFVLIPTVFAAVWLAYRYIIRPNRVTMGDVFSMQYLGWFYVSKVAARRDGTFIVRLYEPRLATRPERVVVSELFDQERGGTQVISLSEDQLAACEPMLIGKGYASDEDRSLAADTPADRIAAGRV